MTRSIGWGLAAALLWQAIGLPLDAAGAQGTAVPPADSARLEVLVPIIGREYVRPISQDSLRLAAQAVLAGTLDPYSRVLDAEGWAALDERLSGAHAGLGVRVEEDSASETVRVTGLVKDSPALRAGLRVGDHLVAINSRPMRGQSFDEVLDAIRGPGGSKVVLTVRRPSVQADLVYKMRRRTMQSPTVRGLRRQPNGEWSYLADTAQRVGYIRIEQFAATTPVELDRALAAVRRAGAMSLVLDIRVNPGGLARAAIRIADRFVESGTLFSFRSRDSLEVFRAHAGGDNRLPLVLLVDGFTQSVAELLAASLQDNGRAAVVGQRSWGKGHAQRMFAFPDGQGGLKLTTMSFVRPSGRPMERHFAGQDSTLGGVWPDPGMAVSLTTHEYDGWLACLFALDDLMPLAVRPGEAPPPTEDRALATAIAVLSARTKR